MAQKTQKQILIEKRNALNERIRKEDSKEKAENRKKDTRRKILMGAAVMEQMKRNEQFAGWVHKLLNDFLTKPDDRALFGLPPLPPPATVPVDNQVTVAEKENEPL